MKYKMRKENRRIAPDELAAVIDRCDVCRMGLFDGEFPYIVPMNFGYEFGDSLYLYFHCAQQGRKLEILKQNPRVCFEMDTAHELKTCAVPCDCSMNYECVMGEGTVEVVNQRDAKVYALDRLLKHYGKIGPHEWREEVLASTCVLRLTVSQISGKHLKK